MKRDCDTTIVNIPEEIGQALQRKADRIGIHRRDLLDSIMYMSVETDENDAAIKETALKLRKKSRNTD